MNSVNCTGAISSFCRSIELEAGRNTGTAVAFWSLLFHHRLPKLHRCNFVAENPL